MPANPSPEEVRELLRETSVDLVPSVHERMVAVLAELPAIGKDQRNPQQGFMFRGHDDILNALNPLLAKHGVFVVPDVLERVTGERTSRSGAVLYEVNLHVRFTFYGASGDSVVASTWGEGTDAGDKATNKAMTMAFKNVLNQAFAISSAEFQDADGETPETVLRQESAGQGFPPPKNWEEIGARFAKVLAAPEDAREWIREAIQAKYGSGFAELTSDDKREAGEMASRTLIDLEEEFAEGVTTPSRDRTAAAFLAAWDVGLHGPPWKVGPDDPEAFPSHEEWEKAQEAPES